MTIEEAKKTIEMYEKTIKSVQESKDFVHKSFNAAKAELDLRMAQLESLRKGKTALETFITQMERMEGEDKSTIDTNETFRSSTTIIRSGYNDYPIWGLVE